MNNCLTDITNITLIKDGVSTVITTASLEEARGYTIGFQTQMGLGIMPMVVASTATTRDLKLIGQLNGCCIEMTWTETFGTCVLPVCTFDLCDYLGA